jgi:hypothetical protein
MEGLEGDAAKVEGVEIAADLIEQLRSTPGVAGVHLMAPGWETEAVPWLLERAGLGYLSRMSTRGPRTPSASEARVDAEE